MKATYVPPPTPRRPASVVVLTLLLAVESAVALGACVFLSLLAPTAGDGTMVALQFAAGGLLLFAIAAYVGARKAHRRRRWVHTFTAVLQLLVVVSIFVATIAGGWQPAFLIGLVLAAALLAVLSMPSLTEALAS
jgi:membrane-associated PAP2 superfamily phosphatase